MIKPSLATSPEYLDHAIAALKVVTQAKPVEHMAKYPYPGPPTPPSKKAEPRIDKAVQLDLFDTLTA